jgi:hypothetical protein
LPNGETKMSPPAASDLSVVTVTGGGSRGLTAIAGDGADGVAIAAVAGERARAVLISSAPRIVVREGVLICGELPSELVE